MSKLITTTAVSLASCALALAAGAQDIPVVLFPFREATVASALDTELKDYRYKIGEPFTNGAIIAELEDARYRVGFLRAKEHRDFSARIAQEQLELRRKDFASEMELRKADYEAKLAAADCEEAEINLRKCLFVAPFDGKIAELLTQRYETVKPGQPLFRIIEDGRLLAVANLPLGSVRVGQSVTVIPECMAPVTGTVYEVAPQADNRTGTVRVRVLVMNGGGQMMAGMTGVLRLDDSVKETREDVNSVGEAIPLLSPGPSYSTVGYAFQGKTPYLSVASDEDQVQAMVTNPPPEWSGREIEVLRLSDGASEVRALPAVAITGLGFQNGILSYSLHRYPRCVSLSSLKRIGEMTAGLYDATGNRLAFIPPCQVSLPASGTTITNTAFFTPAECDAALASGRPLKLILRVDSDVRATDLPTIGATGGGK